MFIAPAAAMPFIGTELAPGVVKIDIRNPQFPDAFVYIPDISVPVGYGIRTNKNVAPLAVWGETSVPILGGVKLQS